MSRLRPEYTSPAQSEFCCRESYAYESWNPAAITLAAACKCWMNTTDIQCRLDHLVLCAADLPEGVTWLESLCAVRLPLGGTHPLMATHNCLSALSANTFLEIIAIDPQAQLPTRPRWFNLDNETFQQQLRQSAQAQLTTWVLATDELPAALDVLQSHGIDAGEPVTLTRGNLQWDIAVRTDGTLAYDGVFPILIQWPSGINPVAQMQDQGLRLEKLLMQHPQAALINMALSALNAGHLVDCSIGEPLLRATMKADGRPFEI